MKHTQTYDETLYILRLLQYKIAIDFVLCDTKNNMTHIIFTNGTFIPIKHQPHEKKHGPFENTDDYLRLLYYTPFNHVNEKTIIYNYEMNKQISYQFQRYIYNYCKQHDIYQSLIDISEHPVKLPIHKRIELYSLLHPVIMRSKIIHIQEADTMNFEELPDKLIIYKLKDSNISFEKLIKQFIEILIYTPESTLQKKIFHKYSYNKLTTSSDYVLLTHKQFIYKEYLSYFEKYSDYIRTISFYETNYNHRKYKPQKDTIVSFYTKYPHKLKSIFGSTIKIIQNTLKDLSDLHVVSTCFDDAQITHITLQNDLQKYIYIS